MDGRLTFEVSVVLITGVNPHGLGAATAHAVASQDPSLLILTYRTREKVDKVIAELKDAHPSVATRTLHLDLADTDSIRQAAKELDSIADHVDVLINNAGVMSVQNRTLTASGIEMHFATNHIGHFLFTNLIMDKLLVGAKKAAKPGVTRVINLSGGWHQFSPVRFNDINFEGKEIPDDQRPDRDYLAKFGHETEDVYIPEVAYAQSKTANILFSVYLTEHLSKFGILSFALNPGGKAPSYPYRINSDKHGDFDTFFRRYTDGDRSPFTARDSRQTASNGVGG